MTTRQEWSAAVQTAARLRTAAAFVVERPDRRDPNAPAIGIPLRLNSTQELARELARRTRQRLELYADARLLPYEPGYRPEHGELVTLAVEDVNGLDDLRNQLRSAAAAEYEGGEEAPRRVLLYGTTMGTQADFVMGVQKFTARQVLREDKVLVLFHRGGVFDQLGEGGFAFDFQFDLFVTENYVFAADTAVLETVIGYLETVRQEARDHAERIVAQLPLANAEEFVQACASDTRFGRKAISVVGRPSFAQVTPAALRAYAQHHEVVLPEDDQGRFIFSNSTEERWRLLKLLDDDYLDSFMTQSRYEVNSKRAL